MAQPPAYRFEGNQKGKPIAADPGKSGSAFFCDGSPLCNEAPFSGIRCTTLHTTNRAVGRQCRVNVFKMHGSFVAESAAVASHLKPRCQRPCGTLRLASTLACFTEALCLRVGLDCEVLKSSPSLSADEAMLR